MLLSYIFSQLLSFSSHFESRVHATKGSNKVVFLILESEGREENKAKKINKKKKLHYIYMRRYNIIIEFHHIWQITKEDLVTLQLASYLL